jgi:hypothetical protein
MVGANISRRVTDIPFAMPAKSPKTRKIDMPPSIKGGTGNWETTEEAPALATGST